MSLWSLFLDNRGRIAHKWKHYFPAYEAHFARYVNRPVVVFEIGVRFGGSLQMWKRYLGPYAQVVGIDIDARCRDVEEDHIAVRIGDQADPAFLQSLIDEFGPPDIVIDDGSHRQSDVISSFRYLYPRMSPDGVYFVEDLQTSYWDEYEGGLRRDGTFIELTKNLIDELNADWTRGALPPNDFTASTLSIHLYSACAVFERGHNRAKSDIKTGVTPRTRRALRRVRRLLP